MYKALLRHAYLNLLACLNVIVSGLTSSKSQSPEGSLVDIETSMGCLVTVGPNRKSTGMSTKSHGSPQTSSKQRHVLSSNESVHVLAIGYYYFQSCKWNSH